MTNNNAFAGQLQCFYLVNSLLLEGEGKVMSFEEGRDEVEMPMDKGIKRVLLKYNIGF